MLCVIFAAVSLHAWSPTGASRAAWPPVPRAATSLCTTPIEVSRPAAKDVADGIVVPINLQSNPESSITSESSGVDSAIVSETPAFSVANARILLAGVAAVYGTNYAAVKVLDEEIGSPAMAAVLRFSLGVAFILPCLASAAARHPRVVQWPVARDGLEVGTWFAFGYMVQACALEHSPAGVQAFLLSLTVVTCPALESILEGKQQPMRVWLAAALAALGVLALEAGSGGMGVGALDGGGAIGLWQPVFFGIGFYRLEQCMHAHMPAANDADDAIALPSEAGITVPTSSSSSSSSSSADAPPDVATVALAFTAWQMVAVLAVSLMWLVVESGGDGAAAATALGDKLELSLASPQVGLTLLWTGVVTTAGCAYAEANCLSALTSAEATVIFASEPLWAAACAWLALGETLGEGSMLGGSLIVGACLLSALADNEEARALTERSRAATERWLAAILGSTVVVEAVEAISENVPPGL